MIISLRDFIELQLSNLEKEEVQLWKVEWI